MTCRLWHSHKTRKKQSVPSIACFIITHCYCCCNIKSMSFKVKNFCIALYMFILAINLYCLCWQITVINFILMKSRQADEHNVIPLIYITFFVNMTVTVRNLNARLANTAYMHCCIGTPPSAFGKKLKKISIVLLHLYMH